MCYYVYRLKLLPSHVFDNFDISFFSHRNGLDLIQFISFFNIHSLVMVKTYFAHEYVTARVGKSN